MLRGASHQHSTHPGSPFNAGATSLLPELPELLLTALGDRDAVLDGEIVAFASKGQPSFGLLQHRMHVHKPTAARESMTATSPDRAYRCRCSSPRSPGERTPGGWIAEPRAALLDAHLAEYPGSGGASTYWYGLEPVIRQASDAARFRSELGVPVLQSGDVAADVYAPWRLPTRAVLYVPQFLDFTAAGFTPATAGAHTLEVIVPADPTLWRTARAVSDAAILVDPVIATHDVLRSPGPDAHEAAGHLRRAIEEGTFRG
ncbi:hypothetical protein [Rhodococcus sp. DMU1]|uniref:hypothetical protein n=1 Tax=Rhodococcus sp. DMU1 TaxID=2722825 RepID=UPI001B2FEC25|nr:hypothetical protein [Rhodococcus sp. DMU1]